MSLLSERHLMTVVINVHKPYFIFKTYVMSVLCTPLQVKWPDFLSDNSDFFLAIVSLYLSILTFFLKKSEFIILFTSQIWLFFLRTDINNSQLSVIKSELCDINVQFWEKSQLQQISQLRKKNTEMWHKKSQLFFWGGFLFYFFNSVVKTSFNCYFTSHHANVVT